MAFNWIGKSEDGKTVVLNRLEEHHFKFSKASPELVRTGAVVDVETTGLNYTQDHIIEIGIRLFQFNRETGELLSLGASYSSFQDPGQSISAEVTSITGITDAMVKGQKIDWTKVDELLGASQIIIAHNASFDRPFIDQKSVCSTKKIWGCSLRQIDWSAKGFTSQKLDVLSIYHGFFNDAHRALSDADSLLYLLSLKNDEKHGTYLHELLGQARKITIQMIASQSPFESKDHLRLRNYRWDAQNKYWSKEIDQEQLQDELKWLEEVVYQGAFRGRYTEIQPVDHFKS
jgi:DNA polymerase-3 subunit epsilon